LPGELPGDIEDSFAVYKFNNAVSFISASGSSSSDSSSSSKKKMLTTTKNGCKPNHHQQVFISAANARSPPPVPRIYTNVLENVEYNSNSSHSEESSNYERQLLLKNSTRQLPQPQVMTLSESICPNSVDGQMTNTTTSTSSSSSASTAATASLRLSTSKNTPTTSCKTKTSLIGSPSPSSNIYFATQLVPPIGVNILNNMTVTSHNFETYSSESYSNINSNNNNSKTLSTVCRGATPLALNKQNELDYFTLDETDYEQTNTKSDQDELAYDVACTYEISNGQLLRSVSRKSMESLLRYFGKCHPDDICFGMIDSNGAKLSLNNGRLESK
jgi:hypothetical protein